MAYCTTADVVAAAGGQKRFDQLTDWNADTDADLDQVVLAIEAAQSEVDSFASKRWSVPLAEPVPNVLKWKTAQLAKLLLLERRERLTDTHEKELERVMEWLKMLSTGKVMPDKEPVPKEAAIIVDKVVGREHDSTDPSSIAFARDQSAGYW